MTVFFRKMKNENKQPGSDLQLTHRSIYNSGMAWYNTREEQKLVLLRPRVPARGYFSPI